jgi:hypothetical protein
MAIYPNGVISFQSGQSRMYDPLSLLFTSLACLSFTSVHLGARAMGVLVETFNPHYTPLVGKLFNNVLHVPFHGALLPLTEEPVLDPLKVEIAENYQIVTEVRGKVKTRNQTRLIVMGPFLNFFEGYRPWLDNHIMANHAIGKKKAFTLWPPVWQMAWVVRNAISHRGRINFTDPNLAPITWEGLTYSHNDHDRKLFELDLGVADLILLLVEMGKALDLIGAPIEPPASE